MLELQCKIPFWIISIVCFFMVSCIRLPLPSEYNNVNPYTGNDVLVFKSSKTGQIDTIYICDLRYVCKDGPIPQFIKKKYLIVDEYIPNYWGDNRGLLDNILYINSKENIGFYIKLNNQNIFYSDQYSLNDLKLKETISITVNNLKYNDVLLLEARHTSNRIEDYDIISSYWSKSNGFIKLIKSNGEEFNLVSKYIDKNKCSLFRNNKIK